MATGKGRVYNSEEIMTKHGCKLPCKNTLPKGTHIWIYYNSAMDVVSIKKITDDRSQEAPPDLNGEVDYGD